MFRLRMVGLLVALLSLGLNAFLVLRRTGAPGGPAPGAATGDTAAVRDPAAGGQAGVAGNRLALCQRELGTLAEQARHLLRRLDRTATLPRLFQLGEPNRAAETTLAPRAARMFQVGPAPVRDHTLECRGSICRLVFAAAESADAEAWRGFFAQSDEVRARVHLVRLEPPFPTHDPVSKEGQREWHAYLRLNQPDGAPRASGRGGE
jgi:hypothetical protein